MAIEVKLQVFEGPLDLLLHLIEKNKVDICDIPIVEITDQYLECVRRMPSEDLNITSEFLLMAATLLDIKARMLLPPETDENDEEIDPREELVSQLLEYKKYKYMSCELKDLMMDGQLRLYREPFLPEEVLKYKEPVDLDLLTKDLDINRLKEIFEAVMKRSADKIDPVHAKFGTIEKETVSMDETIEHITSCVRTKKRVRFREMLTKQDSKMMIVVTFVAMLELIRMGTIRVYQEQLTDEIEIEYCEP